jgi:hypothetical protein
MARHVQRADVELNIARWLRKGFGSAGEVSVTRTSFGWRIRFHVEGVPAHDPEYVKNVTQQFRSNFVVSGWGSLGAYGTVSARVLAGSLEEGAPAEQWVMIPTVSLLKDMADSG